MADYQLIIIGAGPAGGYAAWTAAQAGLRALLVERDKRPGIPVCCAEGVSVEGLTSFVTPPAHCISNTIEGLRLVVSTGDSAVYRPGGPIGYVLDRPAVESYIVEKAQECGAELLLETYASKIKLGGENPAEINLCQRQKTFTVSADYVIAADGVESLIGRQAGIATGLRLKQCETAFQYRVSGIEVESSVLQFYVGPRYSPNGYLWVFPKSDDTANIGVGLNPAEADRGLLKERLDNFISENYPGGKIESVHCGMVPKFVGFDILGRDNVLLVGDAARLIDSLSGAGIARALHTGKLAAESIAEAVAGGSGNDWLQKRYRTRVEDEIGRDMRVFQKAYPIFRKFTEADWGYLAAFLRQYLKNQTAESIDPAALIKSALTTAPGLLRLARHIF